MKSTRRATLPRVTPGVTPGTVLTVFLLLVVFGFAWTSVAAAGLLANHPDAYNDGTGPGPDGSWTGSTNYNSGTGPFSGTIDFAVFSAADFNAAFGGAGYVPTAPLVYTYQVHNTGEHAVTSHMQWAGNPIESLGSFLIEAGDVAPSSILPNGGNPIWQFSSPNIGTGESSYGLAFSSHFMPTGGGALTVNGVLQALSFPVSVGSAEIVIVPEPTTWALLLLGTGLAAVSWRKPV